MPSVPGYSMSQLIKASGVPERTIRQYFQTGVLPRAPNLGNMTVYEELHLASLRAIRKHREEHTMYRLDELRAWLAGQSVQELDAFVAGVPVAVSAPVPVSAAVSTAVPAPAPALLAGERWTHVPLVPGMVLLVREGAPPLVTRLASEIRAKYAAV